MLEISYLEVYKMNLLNTFTIEQNQLLNEAGIYIQDKDYSKDEIKIIFNSIISYPFFWHENTSLHKTYFDYVKKYLHNG